MSTTATGGYVGQTWDEHDFEGITGEPKLTRAHVTNTFSGDIEGTGTLEYVMVYREDGSVPFTGLERVDGRIGNRAGSFVLRHEGTFKEGVAEAHWTIVPGSGTEDLRGLRGEGGFVARHGEEQASYTLDYAID
ncbi:MAG TPA: DUF3224 domain-containing protein [Thermomicrobiaceae bacterium]|nr:DUF3224 domain-containing protein [Thermomicrobiaceae bacterium]